MEFKKAARKQAKLRLAISGPSGSGKTWGALKIAKGLGGKIALIDTERGSASLYSDITEFDTLDLNPPFSPERYIEALKAAEKAGYETVIIDSISHEWTGSGGCLEINDIVAQTKFKGNTWSAWSVTTPRHRSFIDALLQSPVHIIATMRAKTETVQDGGRVKKLGMKSETREGTDYEFTIQLDTMHESHLAVATKDRTRLFAEPHVITEETGLRLKQWLSSGAVVEDSAVQEKSDFDDPVIVASQMVMFAKIQDDAANKEIGMVWEAIKNNKAFATSVWSELKLSPVEFDYIKMILKG